MIPIPRMLWQPLIRAAARQARAGLRFMSDDHHRVRDFAVLELPRRGVPLSPDMIAGELGLSADRVEVILSELDRHLTFTARNAGGAVTWAYPVTVDTTPHRAAFSTGEEAYSP